jgi:thioesterase domain-containing protein/acyl carrier protein
MTVEVGRFSSMSRASLELPTPYVAPEGQLETEIAEIFADVLRIDEVGANDDFFDIGGDSLMAETVSMMEILQRTGYEFPISSLLDFSTPRKIDAALRAGSCSEEGKASKPKGRAAAPGADPQARPPIFVVHGRGGYTLPETKFCQALAEGQKLRMFELPGLRGGRSYERIEDIAEIYMRQIATEYPRGPILLASFCAGGMIALEMASRFAKNGRPIKHLVLIDPPVSRNGTFGFGASGRSLEHKAKLLLHRLLPRAWRLRYYERRWKRGSASSNLSLSPAARAKLHSAYLEYSPPLYSGSVTILASARRVRALQDGLRMSKVLPHRTVHLVFAQHRDLASEPRGAEHMQEAFDAALAG